MVRREFLIGAVLASAAPLLPGKAQGAGFSSDRISVLTYGQGPDIVFIPGLASHAEVFGDIARALSEKYRSHIIQVDGFAGSPPADNATGPVMAPVAEEIVRYIQEEHLNRPAVIGHSMGGTIGMMIAARQPGVVERLMILDMIPFAGQFFVAPDATSETARPRAEVIAAQALSTPPGEITPLLREMFSGMTRSDEARARILDWLGASDRRVVAQSFREVITIDLRPELSRITVPVTVLYVPLPGYAQHPVMGSSYANLLQAHLVEVEASNHFIMLDQPQRMIAEVMAFMRSEATATTDTGAAGASGQR